MIWRRKKHQESTKEALYEIEKTEAALKQAKLEKEQAADPEILELSGYTEKEKTKGTNSSVDPERSSHRSYL